MRRASPGALVLGADYRALGVARSLGRRGIPVWVLRENDDLVATTSRYVRKSSRIPPGTEVAQADFLLRLCDEHHLDGWVLFPTSDERAAAVSRCHERLETRYVSSVPPWDILRWAYDKRLTVELADRAGVASPWSHRPRGVRDVAALDCPFPVILKPAVKLSLNPLTVAKAWRADDRATLLAMYERAIEMVDPDTLIIQELVPGGGEAQFSYAAVCDGGIPVASLVARRTRQYPMDFGRASTFVETIEQPEVERLARRLLAELGLTGLVEVEFKRDHRDGAFKLLDINARAWGWHSIGARAGVDFPYLTWRLLQGERIETAKGRPGVRWVRMTTDLPVVLKEIRRRRLPARAYLASLRGPRESAIFASDDPLPGFLETPLLAYMLGRRLARQRVL